MGFPRNSRNTIPRALSIRDNKIILDHNIITEQQLSICPTIRKIIKRRLPDDRSQNNA